LRDLESVGVVGLHGERPGVCKVGRVAMGRVWRAATIKIVRIVLVEIQHYFHKPRGYHDPILTSMFSTFRSKAARILHAKLA
jgi:hypothetical protein